MQQAGRAVVLVVDGSRARLERENGTSLAPCACYLGLPASPSVHALEQPHHARISCFVFVARFLVSFSEVPDKSQRAKSTRQTASIDGFRMDVACMIKCLGHAVPWSYQPGQCSHCQVVQSRNEFHTIILYLVLSHYVEIEVCEEVLPRSRLDLPKRKMAY